jgi:hypothetical protein
VNEIPEGRRSPPAGALESGSPFDGSPGETPACAGAGRVVHCKRERYDVYIGRPGPWGNPFAINAVHTREAAIEQFEEWASESMHPDAVWIRQHVHELRGKVLGCWCAPKRCHGDVLLKMATVDRGNA